MKKIKKTDSKPSHPNGDISIMFEVSDNYGVIVRDVLIKETPIVEKKINIEIINRKTHSKLWKEREKEFELTKKNLLIKK